VGLPDVEVLDRDDDFEWPPPNKEENRLLPLVDAVTSGRGPFSDWDRRGLLVVFVVVVVVASSSPVLLFRNHMMDDDDLDEESSFDFLSFFVFFLPLSLFLILPFAVLRELVEDLRLVLDETLLLLLARVRLKLRLVRNTLDKAGALSERADAERTLDLRPRRGVAGADGVPPTVLLLLMRLRPPTELLLEKDVGKPQKDRAWVGGGNDGDREDTDSDEEDLVGL